MSVPVQDPINQIIIVGGETLIPWTWNLQKEGEITVLVKRASTGLIDTLTLNTDYTVDANGLDNDNGGNITPIGSESPVTTGDIWTMFRVTAIDRSPDFATGGAFFASTINEQLDELTRINQEANRDVANAVRKDPGVGDILNPLIPQPVDERALKFRDSGGGNFNLVMSDSDPDQQADEAGVSAAEALASEQAAATSETNAATSETNAATSETNAALSAASGYLKNTISVSTNTTLTIANQGNEIRVDTTSGNINITLPDSTTLTEDFRVAIIKISADANVVNVFIGAISDTINGGTLIIQGEQFSRKTYALDQSASTWIVDTISPPVGAIGIAQVISHTTDSQPTIASDTYADIPGFSKAITIQPGSSVLLVAMLTMSNDNNTGSFMRFARDGVKIATSSLGDLDDGTALPGGNVNATLGSLLSGVAGHITLIGTPFYIDPNPTSGVPLTYSIQWRRGTAGVLHLNRNGSGLMNSDVGDYFSTFYLIELTNL